MRRFKDKEEALDFITREIPWGIAAGVCKDGTLARKYAQAGIKIIGYGSITKLPRAGNPGDNFFYDQKTGNSINALGIPNKGFDAHLSELPQLRQDVNSLGSELWVSISAGDKFDPAEYGEMTDRLEATRAADVIEGNFSCGNMKVGEYYKPIVCYDLGAFTAGVAALRGNSRRKIAVKLTPTTERTFLFGNVEVCLTYDADYIVLANTIPNSYLERPFIFGLEEPRPAISMIRGGLGGAALRPVVAGMVQMVAPMLKGTNTKLIWAGGIDDGYTAYNALRHGAHGFVFSTLMWSNNFKAEPAQEVILGKDIDLMTRKRGLVELLVENGLPG